MSIEIPRPRKERRLPFSEAICLKTEDIDKERHILRVRGGKGQKDRYTILLEVALARSVEKVFEQAIERAEIKKEGKCIL